MNEAVPAQREADGTAGRHLSLDALRGLAVMGILLMNAVTFGLPQAAYVDPSAWGHDRLADRILWFVDFVLVEAKMRGLFSLLFGASMALIVDRADARGEDGAAVHLRRLGWLLIFGLVHHLFVWEGDILVQYAVVGAVALPFVAKPPRTLLRWAVGLLAASTLLHAATVGLSVQQHSPTEPAAERPEPADVEEVSTYRGSYVAILGGRADDIVPEITSELFGFGLETLGLMVLGILLLRNGFLTGGWDDAAYRRWAVRAYFVGLPPSVALAAWGSASGFDTAVMFGVHFAWAEPFKYAVLLGHAALAILRIRRFAASAFVGRVAAVGRAAFTNYLGTSIVMTTLFYGYGAGLFGRWGRVELTLVVLGVWALMLLWSKPWLERFRYGPLEWLWRSLARGRVEPLRR